MTTVTERVAAGAAYLDEHDPDWWRKDVENAINLASLRLSSPTSCVLGQRCPAERLNAYLVARYRTPAAETYEAQDWNFWAQAHALSGIEPGTEGDPNWPVVTWSSELGFNSTNADLAEFDALTAEWNRVITERRAAS